MLAPFRVVDTFISSPISDATLNMRKLSTMPQYFELITVINRDVDRQRWKHVEQQFFNAGITNYQRFSAVDGSRLTDDQVKKYVTADAFLIIKSRVRTSHAQLSSFNQLACFLSHTTLWTELLKSKEAYRTIMEDDLSMMPDFLYRVGQSIKDVPNDFDILLWGDIEHARTPWSTVMPGQKWVRVRRFYGCQAYTIKKTTAQKLLGSCFPIDVQLDTFIFKEAAKLDLKIYVHNPCLIRQGKFPSTIQIKGDCLACGRLQ